MILERLYTDSAKTRNRLLIENLKSIYRDSSRLHRIYRGLAETWHRAYKDSMETLRMLYRD